MTTKSTATITTASAIIILRYVPSSTDLSFTACFVVWTPVVYVVETLLSEVKMVVTLDLVVFFVAELFVVFRKAVVALDARVVEWVVEVEVKVEVVVVVVVVPVFTVVGKANSFVKSKGSRN